MASNTNPSKRSRGIEQFKDKLSSKSSSSKEDPMRSSSPDPVCAICLGKHENMCYANSCLHKFCFRCLQEWSKVKAECPLCKQQFSSIFYNVKSDKEYDEYKIPLQEPEDPYQSILDPVHHRFRYRTTLTQERRGALALERLMRLRQFSVEGILPTTQSRPRRSRLSGTSNFRRQIYERDLWVRPLSDITGRYRETTPEFFQHNQAMTHRLVPWLNRELNCLLAHPENRLSYVLEMILRLITQHHICSRPFREAVLQYLGSNTEHFIHEFFQFSRSPFDMYGFDENAQYEPRTRLQHEEVAVSESSSDEEDDSTGIIGMGAQLDIPLPPSPQPGPSGLNRELRAAQLSDDGQSYTPRMPRATSASEVSTTPSTGSADVEEEVEVVRVVRPRNERTPEIITLSDTEEEAEQTEASQESASESRSLRGKALKRRMKSPVRNQQREKKEKRLKENKRKKCESYFTRDRVAPSPSRPLRYWDLDPEQVRHVLHKRNKGSSSKSRSDSSDRKRSRKS